MPEYIWIYGVNGCCVRAFAAPKCTSNSYKKACIILSVINLKSAPFHSLIGL